MSPQRDKSVKLDASSCYYLFFTSFLGKMRSGEATLLRGSLSLSLAFKLVNYSFRLRVGNPPLKRTKMNTIQPKRNIIYLTL